jgi:gas vesicle protein
MMAKDRHVVAFLVGAALGGAAGAVYGLLHAPGRGDELWAAWTERWQEVGDLAADAMARREAAEIDRLVVDRPMQVEIDVTLSRPGEA